MGKLLKRFNTSPIPCRRRRSTSVSTRRSGNGVISRAAQAALDGYTVNLLGTMFFNMMLGRFFGMFIGMQIVAVRDVVAEDIAAAMPDKDE